MSPPNCAILPQILCLGHCYRTAGQEEKQQQRVIFRTRRAHRALVLKRILMVTKFYQAAVPLKPALVKASPHHTSAVDTTSLWARPSRPEQDAAPRTYLAM